VQTCGLKYRRSRVHIVIALCTVCVCSVLFFVTLTKRNIFTPYLGEWPSENVQYQFWGYLLCVAIETRNWAMFRALCNVAFCPVQKQRNLVPRSLSVPQLQKVDCWVEYWHKHEIMIHKTCINPPTKWLTEWLTD